MINPDGECKCPCCSKRRQSFIDARIALEKKREDALMMIESVREINRKLQEMGLTDESSFRKAFNKHYGADSDE